MDKKNLIKRADIYLIRWFVFIPISTILFFSFVLSVLASPEYKNEKQPFFSNICSIVTDGESIYTFDNTFNNICKYRSDGTLEWRLHFYSTGEDYLFMNENAELCRYQTRGNLIYRYDETGATIDVNESNTWKYSNTTKQTVGEVTYSLRKHIITSDKVIINDGKSVKKLTVENNVGQLVFALLCCTFAVCTIFAVYNLLRFLIIKIDLEQKAKK